VENLDWVWHGAKGSLGHAAVRRVGLAAPRIAGERDGECRRRRCTLVGAMILAAVPHHSPGAPPKRRRVLVHLTGRSGLIPVQRDVPGTGEEVEQALRALLRGPTPFELADGIGTEVPAESRLLGVEVEDGVATGDLAPAFAAGGATASVRRRVQQIVHTATACAGIVSVRLRLGGIPVVTLGGGGLLVAGPLTRQAADSANTA